MAKMTYAEQLKHPFWQRKRLEVLQRADFKCEQCSDTETTLHVHHKKYVKGRSAWEYELDELKALCEKCHKSGHVMRETIDRLMATKFAEDALVEEFVYGFLCGFLLPWGSVFEDEIESALRNEPRSFGVGYMMAALGPHDLAAAVRRKIDEGLLEDKSGMLDAILKDEESE